MATIDRATFTKIYIQAKKEAFTKRAIKGGWKRAGFLPLDPSRIKNHNEVKNFERTTPQLSISPDHSGLYKAPHSPEAITRLADDLAAIVTPTKRVAIRKLAKAASDASTKTTIAARELKQHRGARKDAIKKKHKCLELSGDRRVSWTTQEIIEARTVRFSVSVYKRRPGTGRIHSVLKVTSSRLQRI